MHIFLYDEFSNLHYAAFYSSKNFNHETNFLLFSLYILDPRLHKKITSSSLYPNEINNCQNFIKYFTKYRSF